MKSTVAVFCAVGIAVLVSGARADVQILEAVGTIPIDPLGNETKVPRDAAIDQALRLSLIHI